MSLSRLSAVAVQRETTPPQRAKKKPKTAAETQATETQGYVDLLVAAIPTEPLALYTFVVGGIVATIDSGESQRLGLRWGIYVVMLVFIVLWLAFAYRRRTGNDRKRRFPVAEIAAAVVAFAAWGLVMPESPLYAELSGDDRVVWTILITGAGAAVLSLITGKLKTPAR
jgi:hypothetical protein